MPPALLTRRDYFAIEFALKLMHVKQVAPGKVAVPRDSGDAPSMQIQCEMGIAIRMADDLCFALDTTVPAPQPPTVVEPPMPPHAEPSNQ